MQGFAAIGLDNPKSAVNVGAVLRAAYCYRVAMVALSGHRVVRGWSRSPTDTVGAYRHIPVIRVTDLNHAIPFDCVPVAVDLVDGATPLPEYEHPQRAYYIFGAEDATLGKRVLSWCRDVVMIPTEACLNLAMTANTVLYDRLAKEKR